MGQSPESYKGAPILTAVVVDTAPSQQPAGTVPPTVTFPNLARPKYQSCPTAPGHLRLGSLVLAGGVGHRALSAP